MSFIKLAAFPILLSSLLSHAEGGFFKVTDPKVPEVIRQKQKSVLRFMALTEEPMASIPREKYGNFNKLADDKIFLESFERRILLRVIKECSDKDLPTCPIYLSGTGSAFIVDDKLLIWTVRHNVQKLIDEIDKKNPSLALDPEKRVRAILATSPKIQLYTEEGIKVFDSSTPETGDKAEYQRIGDVQVMRKALKCDEGNASILCLDFINDPVNDFVTIKINRDLGITPLESVKRQRTYGEAVYALGFPGITSNRAAFGFQEADDLTLNVSIGKIQSSEEALTSPSWLGLAREQREQTFKLMSATLLFTSADGAQGLSGGPILDKDGKVLGIAARSSPDYDPNDVQLMGVPAGMLEFIPGFAPALQK